VFRQEVHTGASWGAVIDNFGNLFLFRYKDAQHVWRVWLALGVVGVLLLPSLWVYSQEQFRNSWARTILTWGWLVSPVLLLVILQGAEDLPMFPYLKPDDIWGGFLLTVIISVFAIVASFPAGVLLALGRRSQVYGIPYQVTYGLAALLTLYFLATSTPANLTAARSNVETVFAFWPLLLPLLAYLFQRNFQGNAIAAFSTIFIEVIRGVPLITVLFMSIILFPIFLPPTYGDAVRSFLPDFIANGLLSLAPDWSGRAVEILGSWRVMVAFAIFSAAYLAENVRGGLQALSKGQYEAADALGLSTFQKYYYIILPQALRLVIPAMVGQFIALFKDTSLVYLVGLFDFLAVANSIASQPKWLGIRTEPYILLLAVYFVGSSLMASYSLYLERRLGVGER
jgi:general L-amino acid transport system permease protein